MYNKIANAIACCVTYAITRIHQNRDSGCVSCSLSNEVHKENYVNVHGAVDDHRCPIKIQ